MASAMTRSSAQKKVRDFNELYKIGTDVIHQGEMRKTWSHAGLGFKDEPVVFLEGLQEPVPLNAIKVSGWDDKEAKKKKGKR